MSYRRRDYRNHIDGFCKQCGELCESKTIDVGIGAYEYWGAVGIHKELVEVSPCCESEVIERKEDDEILFESE